MKKSKVIALMAVVLVLIPSIYLGLSLSNGSLKILTVLSGSMYPAMDPGDVVVVSEIDLDEVKTGDIVTFRGGENLVTHRVVEIIKESELKFKTKGDANEDPDQSLVSSEDVVGKVMFVIPKMGYFGKFIRTPLGYLLFILIPGLLIIFSETRKIMNHGKEKKKKKTGYPLKENLFVLFILFSVISLSTPDVYAFFNDGEMCGGNTYSTGTLDFSLFSPNDNFVPSFKAGNMKPGDEVNRMIQVRNEGSLSFQYTAHTEKISGDDDFCQVLELEAKLGGTIEYSGGLMDFNFLAKEMIDPPGIDTWHFKVSLPSDVPGNLQGKSCRFKFVFDCWQTNLPDSSSGFNDQEEIESDLTAGECTTTTATTSTTTTVPTTTILPPASEFPIGLAPLMILLAAPAFTYLLVKKRK